jgi:hypothetical protein
MVYGSYNYIYWCCWGLKQLITGGATLYGLGHFLLDTLVLQSFAVNGNMY